MGWLIRIDDGAAPVVTEIASAPEPSRTARQPVVAVPKWRPRGDGLLIRDGRPVNHRLGRNQKRPETPPYAVVHADCFPARSPASRLTDWLARQDERYAGYHAACALDLDEPQLLARWSKFRMNHGGPWNAGFGVVAHMHPDDWAGLEDWERAKLATQVLMVLRRVRCSSDAVIDGVRVSDDRTLHADRHGDVEHPPRGTFVAHDWLVTDSRGDVKWDPGEGLMDEVCRIRAASKPRRSA